MRRVAPGQLTLPMFAPPARRRAADLPPSPFEQGPVLNTLRELNGLLDRTLAADLAMCLERSERTTRLYLQRLEGAGMVRRPDGPRSGWVAV